MCSWHSQVQSSSGEENRLNVIVQVVRCNPVAQTNHMIVIVADSHVQSSSKEADHVNVIVAFSGLIQ